MKISRLIPLIVGTILLSGASLLAQTPTYIFFPFTGNTGFNGQITLDAPTDSHGTTADVVSWYISDPSGVFTPQNSTLETTGFVDWNSTSITLMGLTIDTNGVPAVGMTQTNIFEEGVTLHAPQTVNFGVWKDVPETSSTVAMLLLVSAGLGAYHFRTIRKKA